MTFLPSLENRESAFETLLEIIAMAIARRRRAHRGALAPPAKTSSPAVAGPQSSDSSHCGVTRR